MSGEKTEEPTPQKLRKAREQGDVPVSGALTQWFVLLFTVSLLPAFVGLSTARIYRLLRESLSLTPVSLEAAAGVAMTLLLPFLGLGAAAAVAVGAGQTGANFAPSKLAPKLENINPVQQLKKLVSLDRLIQIARGLVTAIFVTWLAVKLFISHAKDFDRVALRPGAAAALSHELTMDLLWMSVGVMAMLAVVDVLVTRRSWLKRNRMTKDEVKRQHKESEGDAQQKQERKRAHQEMLNNAGILAVKDASVLVVNPTHIATALRYDPEQGDAPQLVAKGEGDIAKRMMDAARAYGIPVVRDVPVARALRELEIGEEIPEKLYEAVAEVLQEAWAESAPPPATEAPEG